MSFPILTIALSPSPEASKAEKSFQSTDIPQKSGDAALPRSQAPEVANCHRNWDFAPPPAPWGPPGLWQSRRAHVRALINAL